MAAIDNIYLKTKREYIEFYEWSEMFDEECLKETGHSILECFFYRWYEVDDKLIEYPTTNTPIVVDKWLWSHCPLNFIREYMSEQWGYNDKNRSKWLFYIDKAFDREKFRQQKTLNALVEEISNEYIDNKDKEILKEVYYNILNGKRRYNFVRELSHIGYNYLIY